MGGIIYGKIRYFKLHLFSRRGSFSTSSSCAPPQTTLSPATMVVPCLPVPVPETSFNYLFIFYASMERSSLLETSQITSVSFSSMNSKEWVYNYLTLIALPNLPYFHSFHATGAGSSRHDLITLICKQIFPNP